MKEENKKRAFSAGEYRRMLNSDSSFKVKEAYNRIRTKLMFTARDEECPVYAVVSARANEGKTINSINLAISFAMAGKRTLIIDGDLRNPSVHKYFKVSRTPGLSEVLAKIQSKVNVMRTDQENLYFLRAGNVPPNPAELIGSPVLGEILTQLKEKFDCIFIDLPPAGVVSDAALIGSRVNGYIFVVKTMNSELPEISRAVEMLRSVGGNIVGFVVNDVEGEGEKYNGYGYGYGKYSYSYGEKAE